jgi:death-on-curing protein
VHFLDVGPVFAMQEEILEAGGGTPGILNVGAVDSALYRCKWGPFLGDPALEERSALLLRGLGQDHPFADGNKRTALAATVTFLRRNGLGLLAGPHEATQFMLAVAQDQVDLAGIAEWMSVHARNLKEKEMVEMSPMTEKPAPPPKTGKDRLSPEDRRAFETVMRENAETLRRLAKL